MRKKFFEQEVCVLLESLEKKKFQKFKFSIMSLKKHENEINKAWKSVLDDKDEIDWYVKKSDN